MLLPGKWLLWHAIVSGGLGLHILQTGLLYSPKVSEKNETQSTGTKKEDPATAYQNSLQEFALSSQKDLLNEMSASLSEVNKEVTQSPETEVCERDYTVLCPQGWTEVPMEDPLAPSVECAAPDSYTHSKCPRIMSFNLSAKQKAEKEFECNIQWKCRDETESDVETSLCPLEWKDSGGGFCTAPPNYKDCAHRVNFSIMSPTQRAEYAVQCNIKWPAKKAAEPDFTNPCPAGWLFIKSVCNAPDAYKGPCGPTAVLTHFSAELKRQFAERCGAPWPAAAACPNGVSLSDSICPEKWQLEVATQRCLGPAIYVGECQDGISVTELRTDADKREIAKRCSVTWPCAKECNRAYEQHSCPFGWSSRESKCEAPNGYRGPCGGSKQMVELNNTITKKAFAKLCNAPWPCEGDYPPMLYQDGSNVKAISVHLFDGGPIEESTGKVVLAH